MRVRLGSFTFLGALSLLSCSSEPINDANASGGGNAATGGTGSSMPSACSGALRQSLGLVDEVSTRAVSIITDGATERTLYVDASEGDGFPWVYVSLGTGQALALTDIEALGSKAWDLAFKRFVVRTNSGDSGPGNGGAFRVALAWDKVDASTLGKQMLPGESWFDADCNLGLDETMQLITSFSGWSEYDQVTHLLTPADVVYITAGADGALYKVAILDYYSTVAGKHGPIELGGHYKLRVAPLP